MAEAIVSFVVETIGTNLIEEGKFLSGANDKVEQLQLGLNRMLSFLRDADARQNDEELIKEWISQAKDLAYEADGLLESFAFRVATRRSGGIKNIFKRFACILNECYAKHKIGSEIEKLNIRITELNRSFQDYGIRALMERDQGSSSWERELRRTYSHVSEDDFVGLDGDIEKLVEQLVKENEMDSCRVVSVYGMAGLGKSTIARKVYNHPRVKQHFDGFAWVCISQQWKRRDILQGILIRLVPDKREEMEKWRDEELVRQLFQTQRDRRCLVVLDDIWKTDAWECIKQAFPIRKDGSKILLTTRNRDVAEHIGPSGFHHEPRLLRDDESWELLQKKISRERHDQDCGDTGKMEELGKEMVKRCGGLPLAVVVLGGILVTKQNPNEWEAVATNFKAYLQRADNIGQHQGEVHKILALSYNILPYKLKPCFLYLGKYHEDSYIDVETLYQLWIAEGMISIKDQIGEESMLEVAEHYLGELVQRCMVQVETHDAPRVTRFKSCRLHDLMRDMCLLKAEEENFFFFVNHQTGFKDDFTNVSSLSRKIQRLVTHLRDVDLPNYAIPARGMTRNLRSLTFSVSGKYEGHMPKTVKSQFKKLKMLRVLMIEGLSPGYTSGVEGDFCVMLDHLKLPNAIGKLIHLRYLSLRGSSFWWLTSSLGNLQHLQTLDLRGMDVLGIPNVLWKMRELRYLYFLHQNFSHPFCKLRLDSLSKLEILENFNTKFCRAKDLSKLTNLRVLTALAHKDLKDVKEIMQYISNSKLLRCSSLEIWCHNSFISEEGLTIVRQFLSCSNLHRLKIRVPIGSLPKHEASFSSGLIELLLQRSQLEEDPMETLEKLPNLQRLVLFYDSFLGKEMICHARGFPQLRFLQLARLPNLESWRIDEGAMPNLSRLLISSCLKLQMIPDGLRFTKTLKELEIQRMPTEFSERVRVVDGQEGEDISKICHVQSIIIS